MPERKDAPPKTPLVSSAGAAQRSAVTSKPARLARTRRSRRLVNGDERSRQLALELIVDGTRRQGAALGRRTARSARDDVRLPLVTGGPGTTTPVTNAT